VQVKEIVQERLVTPGVRSLVGDLWAAYKGRLGDLLHARTVRRAALSSGSVDHLVETANVRNASWQVDPVPDHLLERRVELIGGANRSELINGMNAGAKSYIADLWNFTPQDTWSILRAHKSLSGAAKRDLAYLDDREGRVRINPATITRLMMVPRPYFVYEAALQVDGAPAPGAFFDLAMAATGHGTDLIARQGGLHLYLRDVQSHLEARLWARTIEKVEEHLEVERGTIRCTVMLDTIAGALEAEEILFELQHHSAGLSLDPQAYAADHIALFHGPDRAVLPDRETIGLNAPFLRALSLRTIGICHRRGCHAMGAPSFMLPSLDRNKIKAEYLEMLADKEREAVDGHDGTLVVHEDMVNASMVEFNKSMPRAHQMGYQRSDVITPADLIRRPEGTITVESLKSILRTALRSLMLREQGKGWVIQGGRIHDRSSLLLAIRLLWQWNHSTQGNITATNLPVTIDLIKFMLKKEADKMFEVGDPVIRKQVDRAMAYIVELADSDGIPML
jgi:malate synthase